MTRRYAAVLHSAVAAFAAAVAVLSMTPGAAASTEPLPGQRVVLVTGSTGGLGREVARELARNGDHVIVHGRSVERGAALVDEINAGGKGSARFYRADFASLDEVRAFADSIVAEYDRLDVLVNNAGVAFPAGERRLSEDGYELHFQVNYLAGYLLIAKLLPLLEASAPSRIVNVSSGAQEPPDFADINMAEDYDGMRAYGQSKLAQVMMTYAMADDLAKRGIVINALHPSSYMDTDMVIEAGFEPQSSVETGRDAVIRLINEDLGTGRFFNVFEEWRSHDASYDDAIVGRLMEQTAEMVAE